MQRLLGIATALVIGVAMMLVAAQRIGATAPPPQLATFWHLYDCELPCWAGIVLRQTSHEVAKAHLLNIFGSYAPVVVQSSSMGFALTLHNSIGKPIGYIRVAGERGIATTINLEFAASDPQQIRQIVQIYGLPTCGGMGFYTDKNDFTVMFDRPLDGVSISVSQTLMLAPTIKLAFEAPASRCTEKYSEWHGFTYR